MYLQFAQFLSRWRTAQAVSDLFGVPISAGTVSGFGTKAAAGLGGFVATVTDLFAGGAGGGFRRDVDAGGRRQLVGSHGLHARADVADGAPGTRV